MKRFLVTGASGQIGSELVPALRDRYGADSVIAAGHTRPLAGEITASGPCTRVDVTSFEDIERAIREFQIDSIYHLSSILSALAEQQRRLAYQVNINGLCNVLEAACMNRVERVIIPSSIAAFGPSTPRDNTPNDTLQRPNTIYGISKVFGELLGNYYHEKVGLDVRGVRLPGIISWKVEPTAGTTDYAVAAFYGALRERRYRCYLRPDTYLPMMYMPDAVRALMEVAEADVSKLQHHADFNVSAMSFAPEDLAQAITKRMPDFTMEYQVDPLRQSIADSWPNSLDDSPARAEWGWQPEYNLETMVEDMLRNLSRKLASSY